MHLVLQLPIVDFRRLEQPRKTRLDQPAWPSPDARTFIRNFGIVCARRAGGSAVFSGEEFFCNAHGSLHYKNLQHLGLQLPGGGQAAIVNSYRRLYSDGKFMNKLELGFIDNSEKRLLRTADKGPLSMIAVLKHYMDLPVTVNGKETKLSMAFRPLKRLFCKATTIRGQGDEEVQKQVVDGQVCVTIVFSTTEGLALPLQAKKINEYQANEEYIRLYGYRFHHEDSFYKVWFIEISRQEKLLSQPLAELLRKLRMNLLRVHAEKETIRVLLNGIKTGAFELVEGSPALVKLNKYIQETSEKLFKKNRFSLQQADMLEFALQGDDLLLAGDTSLKESIESFFQEHTQQNIERLIQGMSAEDKRLILVIASSPSGKNPVDFGKDLKKIQDALEASADRGNYDIRVEPGVKKEEVFKILDKYKPSYLHITLHASDIEGLYFEGADGSAAPMSAIEFGNIVQLVSSKKKPQVIVLSACNSKAHAEAVKTYCFYSMGTKAVFPEKAGVIYAQRFYETLFNDNYTDIPYCHKAAVLAIEQTVPPFGPQAGFAVQEIPELITA